jgi:hypothetical protein
MATASVMATGRRGYAFADVSVNEGGTSGVIEYYAEAPLFGSDGAARLTADVNQDLRNTLDQERANQGFSDPASPPIQSMMFYMG